jgi:hypothetical protein
VISFRRFAGLVACWDFTGALAIRSVFFFTIRSLHHKLGLFKIAT